MSDWIDPAKLPVAWLSLDHSDNGLFLFFRYFIAALQKIDNDIGINKLAVLQDDTHLLIPLVNELTALETNFILVLDDYHNIAESEIHEVLDFLFDLVPLYWQQLTSLEMELGNEKIV